MGGSWNIPRIPQGSWSQDNPNNPAVTTRQADIPRANTREWMGAAYHQPCYTHVISKTLIKTKDANCTRLCCLCCGSVMASTLPWARSLLLHRGCFALSCLFSSYWGFFWQDSRCLLRVVEQEDTSQSSWTPPGESCSLQSEEPHHPALLPTPPAAPWSSGRGSLPRARVVGGWRRGGSGSLEPSWEGVLMGRGHPAPRAPQ